jgi:hypothetical protein
MLHARIGRTVAAVAIALTIAACGGTAANDPATTVNAVLAAVSGGKLDQLDQYVCPADKVSLPQLLGGSGSISGLPPDVADLLKAMTISYENLTVTPGTVNGDTATVHVTATVKLGFDDQKLSALVKGMLQAQGQPTDDLAVSTAVAALKAQLPASSALDTDVTLQNQGGKWLICSPSGAAASPVPAPSSPGVVVGGGGGSGGGGAGGNGGAGNGAGSGGGSGGNAGSGGSSEESPTPTSLLTITSGPYAVKQIETLGGEKISGTVCSTSAPFVVAAATSKVAWTFGFLPTDADKGKVSYAYNIPSAGESHAASGTYTIAQPGADGTRRLSLQVSDHVVFKGFDGNIPLRYKFDLVPTGITGCP